MEVIRAKTAGFCFGVSRALRLLDEEIDATTSLSPQPRLITLGSIIHNPIVIASYTEKGVLCYSSVDGIEQGDHVIIRAHGIPQQTKKHLQSIGAIIIDATCPKVRKAQERIATQQAEGGTLLLFGEAHHPEVVGLLSYANEDALVFESLEELKRLPLDTKKDYFLAAQTTQDKEMMQEIIYYLNNFLHTPLPVLNTICDATHNRQEEVIQLAQKVDGMVVVGGLNSGNTKRLAEIASAHGTPTIHVEQITDAPHNFFAQFQTIGLTAGASTPDEHINAAQQFLESYNAQ